jgi:hypothetical protein
MAIKTGPRRAYVPNDSFVAHVDGVDKIFQLRKTVVFEGDPILERYPHLFEELDPRWETRG